jgi:hypothetical protein
VQRWSSCFVWQLHCLTLDLSLHVFFGTVWSDIAAHGRYRVAGIQINTFDVGATCRPTRLPFVPSSCADSRWRMVSTGWYSNAGFCIGPSNLVKMAKAAVANMPDHIVTLHSTLHPTATTLPLTPHCTSADHVDNRHPQRIPHTVTAYRMKMSLAAPC